MAWTNWGFDGTINESQWSQMAGLLGNDYVAAGNGDCVVTAVGGARSVSVAAGTLYGDGVVSVNSAPEVVAMTTPVNGQWYVIALRRTWATNTVALVAIAGATTSTSVPTAPPTSFPTLNTQPGVLTDQPIAWAWCNSANTTVVVYDIRKRAVKSMPVIVADANERNAKFMTPWQGLQVWRNDLGTIETYYDLVSVGNPGGRDSAGWYTDTRAMGLVPLKPQSISYTTGSASINALGVISFTGVSTLEIKNIFSAIYANYRLVVNIFSSSAATEHRIRLMSGTSIESGLNYWSAGYRISSDASASVHICGQFNQFFISSGTSGSFLGQADGFVEVLQPALSRFTRMNSYITGQLTDGRHTQFVMGSSFSTTNPYDGFQLLSSTGTISGTIQILGYND